MGTRRHPSGKDSDVHVDVYTLWSIKYTLKYKVCRSIKCI